MEPVGASKPLRAACRPITRQRKRLQSCSDTESCASARPAAGRKRARRGPSSNSAPPEPCLDGDSPVAPPPTSPTCSGPAPAPAPRPCPHDLSLFVRWHCTGGGVKVNRLRLQPFDRVEDLRGLSRRLVRGAFAGAGELPDYLTRPEWYRLSPADELISLPGDIARTEFRLVVTLAGWEYTVCERTLPGTPDPDRRLCVTLAEFESDAVTVSDHRYVVRLLSYPTVSVKRSFLDAAVAALLEARVPGGPSASSASSGSSSGAAGDSAVSASAHCCQEADSGAEHGGDSGAQSALPSPSLSAA